MPINIPKEDRSIWSKIFSPILDATLAIGGAVAAPFTGGASAVGAGAAIAAKHGAEAGVASTKEAPPMPLSIDTKGLSLGSNKIGSGLVPPNGLETANPAMKGLSLSEANKGEGLLSQPEMKAPSSVSFGDVAKGAQMGLGLAQGGLSIANAFKGDDPAPQPLQNDLERGNLNNPAQDLLRLQDSMRAAMTLPRAQREQILPTFQQAMDELKGRLG